MFVGSKERAEARRVRRSVRGLAVGAAFIAALIFAASAVADPSQWWQSPRFGAYYLTSPCCNGDTFNGTGASIIVNSANPNSQSCLLFRSTAEANGSGGPNGYLLQSGIVRCASGFSVDNTCSLSNNLVKFVETEVNGQYTCYPHGAVSFGTSHTATPQNASGNLWYSFIDGTAYESNTFVAAAIAESGEHNGPNADNCSGWSGSATFGSSAPWPWERYVIGSSGWVQIQSSYTHAGCWSLSGGPPNSFTISH